MKKNKKIFIAIIIILIVAAILVGIYFINKKSEKFNLTSVEKYSSVIDELVEKGIVGPNGEYIEPNEMSRAYVKNQYSVKKLLKGPSGDNKTPKYLGPFTPRITKDELDVAKADHETSTYVAGIADATSNLISTSLKNAFNVFAYQDKESLENLGIQVGLALLSTGLAMLGLGGLGNAITGIFAGQGGQPSIDYDRIKKIMKEALDERDLQTETDKCRGLINSAIEYGDIYLGMKRDIYAKCPVNYSNVENINCIKSPSIISKRNLDLNIVNIKEDVVSIHTRTFLTNNLTDNNNTMRKLITDDPRGKDFILIAYKYDIKSSIKYYPLFILLIGINHTYYQEVSLVDPTLVDNKFVNPYVSNITGNNQQIGKKQPVGSLLGSMQNLCNDFFEYVKQTCKNFNNSLEFYKTKHAMTWNRGPYTKYWCRDVEDIIPDEIFIKNYPYFSKDPHWEYKIGTDENSSEKNEYYSQTNTRRIFQDPFIFYLNYRGVLENLKKVSGIVWLKNEKNFNLKEYAANKDYIIPISEIEYDPEGGYPFGISAPSYKKGVDAYLNPKSYDNIEQTNNFKTYCSPDIIIDNSSLNNSTCLNFKPSINKFDASIFNNIEGQDKIYNENMICEDLYADTVKSCLKPGVSPGNIDKAIPNSRYTYCYNSKTGKTSQLLNTNSNLTCDNSETLYDLSKYISMGKKINPFSVLSLENFNLSSIDNENVYNIGSKITLKNNENILKMKTTIFSNNSYCKDTVENCEKWATNGDCKTNSLFMLDKCKFSCGVCEEKDLLLKLDWELKDLNENNLDNDTVILKIFPSCLMKINNNTSYSPYLEDYFPRIPNNKPQIFNSNNLISLLTDIKSDFIFSNIIIDSYDNDSFLTAKIDISYRESSTPYYKIYFIFTSVYCIKKDDYILVKIKGVKIKENPKTSEEFYLEGRMTTKFDKLSFLINNNWIDCEREIQVTTIPPSEFPVTEFPIIIDKCGYGTPVPSTKSIIVSERSFIVELGFYKVDYNLVFLSAKQMMPILKSPYLSLDRGIVCYICEYSDNKEIFNISTVLRKIFDFYNFKSKEPYIRDNVMLSAPIVLNPPKDPGLINNTTRPPINTECKIIGNDYIKVLSANIRESNHLYVTVEIKGEDVSTTPYPFTTQFPTTQQPTTQYPTTQFPTTQQPTTQYPTTQYPTTQYPTTQYPTTQYPTSQGICDPSYKNTCTPELLNNGYCVSQYGSCGKGDAWCNENSLWTSKCNK
jgi:hypothetical protein